MLQTEFENIVYAISSETGVGITRLDHLVCMYENDVIFYLREDGLYVIFTVEYKGSIEQEIQLAKEQGWNEEVTHNVTYFMGSIE